MRGTNAGLMKENNKCLILRMIRRGGYSRAGLAKETGLTKATISLLTDELMQSGLIFDEPAQDTAGVGRNPLILKPVSYTHLSLFFQNPPLLKIPKRCLKKAPAHTIEI